MKVFAVGDIHGAHLALEQVLERSGFDKENNLLITLGDIADGWPFVYECVEILISIKNRIDIRGNHDDVFVNWMNRGIHDFYWSQGALATAQSYANHADRKVNVYGDVNSGGTTDLTTLDLPDEHVKFFRNQHYYYIDSDRNYCFVHGGFNRHFPIKEQDKSILIWDRDLFMAALSDDTRGRDCRRKYPFKIKDNFSKVFLGHTSTINWNTDKPMLTHKIVNLDTGAGFNGKLTIMNVDTLEYWQSDPVKELYTNIKGR